MRKAVRRLCTAQSATRQALAFGGPRFGAPRAGHWVGFDRLGLAGRALSGPVNGAPERSGEESRARGSRGVTGFVCGFMLVLKEAISRPCSARA
jgi:hypothetical protein